MSSFTAKNLRVTFILGGTNQVFPGTNSNTLQLQNMRMSARIQAVVKLAVQAEFRVWGMKSADMNALSVIWAQAPVVNNHLMIIEANSTGRENGWVQVFKGTIIEGQPDFRDAPNVPMTVLASTGYFGLKITPAQSTSFPGEVPIAQIAANLVAQMGKPWTFLDGGATGVLHNQYLDGPLWDQLAKACAAAKADFYIQGDEVLVTPFAKPRKDRPAVALSPTSGLVGYPMFERSGLNVLALYNPAFVCGSPLDISSPDVPAATGRWYPYAISLQLESKLPHGAWFASMQCNKVLI